MHEPQSGLSTNVISGQSKAADCFSFGVFLIATAAMGWWFLQRSCLCLDDAYIYLTAARNISAGFGPVINPGDTHSAATSGLWVALIANLINLKGTEGQIETQLTALSIIALSVTSYLLYQQLNKTYGALAGLVPVATFSTPMLSFFTGMESAIALLLAVASSTLLAQKRQLPLTAFVIGLAYLGRAEMIAFAPIALFASSIRQRELPPRRIMLASAAALIAAPLLWHTYLLFLVGEFFPSTFSAKLAQGASGQTGLFREHLVQYIMIGAFGSSWLLVVAIIGACVAIRALWPLFAFWIIHILVYSAAPVPVYSWYFYDTIFIVRLCIIVAAMHFSLLLAKYLLPFIRSGLPKIDQQAKAILDARITASRLTALSVLALAWAIGGPGLNSLAPSQGERNQYKSYSKVAAYISSQGLQNRGVILTPEVGVLSFLLPHATLRDINGLATPGLKSAFMNNWQRPYELYHPRYIVPMFNEWTETVTFVGADDRIDHYERSFIAIPNAGPGERHAPVYERSQNQLEPLSAPAHLKFNKGTPSGRWLSLDWLPSEFGYWTSGSQSSLALQFSHTLSNYEIALHVYPFIDKLQIPRQRLSISQGGKTVYETEMKEPRPYVHRFRGKDEVSRIVLKLSHPDAAVPAVHGINSGRSPIAIMLLELEVKPL